MLRPYLQLHPGWIQHSKLSESIDYAGAVLPDYEPRPSRAPDALTGEAKSKAVTNDSSDTGTTAQHCELTQHLQRVAWLVEQQSLCSDPVLLETCLSSVPVLWKHRCPAQFGSGSLLQALGGASLNQWLINVWQIRNSIFLRLSHPQGVTLNLHSSLNLQN